MRWWYADDREVGLTRLQGGMRRWDGRGGGKLRRLGLRLSGRALA